MMEIPAYTGETTTFSIFPFGPGRKEFVINAQFTEQEIALLRGAHERQEALSDFVTSSSHDARYRVFYLDGFRVPYSKVLEDRQAGLQAILEQHLQLTAFLADYPAEAHERNMHLFTELTQINETFIIILQGAGLLSDE